MCSVYLLLQIDIAALKVHVQDLLVEWGKERRLRVEDREIGQQKALSLARELVRMQLLLRVFGYRLRHLLSTAQASPIISVLCCGMQVPPHASQILPCPQHCSAHTCQRVTDAAACKVIICRHKQRRKLRRKKRSGTMQTTRTIG